jgi:hypothetical protein
MLNSKKEDNPCYLCLCFVLGRGGGGGMAISVDELMNACFFRIKKGRGGGTEES